MHIKYSLDTDDTRRSQNQNNACAQSSMLRFEINIVIMSIHILVALLLN